MSRSSDGLLASKVASVWLSVRSLAAFQYRRLAREF
jgi:hypothetical protein